MWDPSHTCFHVLPYSHGSWQKLGFEDLDLTFFDGVTVPFALYKVLMLAKQGIDSLSQGYGS